MPEIRAMKSCVSPYIVGYYGCEWLRDDLLVRISVVARKLEFLVWTNTDSTPPKMSNFFFSAGVFVRVKGNFAGSS